MYLGFFYYTIGNISPKFPSSLKATQLLAVTKSSVIEKYGANVVLGVGEAGAARASPLFAPD